MEMDQITIDIDELMMWPDGDDEKWWKHSIFRIPPHMKDENPRAYTPQMVSIGPYHFFSPHLAPMKEHKIRSLKRFLARTKHFLKDYINALVPLTDELFDSYQLLDKYWRADPTKFLMLMVLDFAFLSEFLPISSADGRNCDPKDPVFNSDLHSKFSSAIMHDVMMMENQIPMTVITKLNDIVDKFDEKKGEEEAGNDEVDPSEPLHMLDYLRKRLFNRNHKSTNEYFDPYTPVKSASELLNAGAQFRVIDDDDTTRGISFEAGILNLPIFWFDDNNTEPFFLNMIAFEKLHPTAGREVSSYVAFMHGLISSPRDVSILKSHGLFPRSRLRSKEILNMVNKISKNVIFDPNSELCKVRDSFNEYYAKKMKSKKHRMKLLLPQWWQNLLQTHFKSPWTILSFLAATVLLVLTLLQTIYTMIDHRHLFNSSN